MRPGHHQWQRELRACVVQSTRTTQTDIVQIGIGQCSKRGGCGGHDSGALRIPDDGQLHFFYTKYDDSGGRVYLADGWYGSAPIIGHKYRMKVVASGASWVYSIRNVTQETDYVTQTRERTWQGPRGTLGWWGGETFYWNDAMGNASPESADLDIQTQYQLTGVWYQTNGADQFCSRYFSPEIQFPSYYHCYFITGDIDDERCSYTPTTTESNGWSWHATQS